MPKETLQNKKKVENDKNISVGGLSSENIMETPLMQQRAKEQKDIFGDVLQAKMKFEGGTSYLDNTKNSIAQSAYNKVQDKARAYYDVADLTFKEGNPGSAAAKFTPDSSAIMGGEILVKTLDEGDKPGKVSYEYTERLIEVSHETHHAIDHMEDLDLKNGSYESKVISEFRTFAVQSAVAFQMLQKGEKVSGKYRTFMKSFDPNNKDSLLEATNNGFARGHIMFKTIKDYLTIYSKKDYTDSMTEDFIHNHQKELDRALNIYNNLKDNQEGEHDFYTTQESYDEESEPTVIDDDGTTMSTITKKTRNVRKRV